MIEWIDRKSVESVENNTWKKLVTVLFDWYRVKQQMQSPFTFHNTEEKVSFLCQGKTIDKVGKKDN